MSATTGTPLARAQVVIALTGNRSATQAVLTSDDGRFEFHVIAGKYSLQSLQKAVEAMNQDGLVVLKGVIDVKHIEALNAKMCADAEKKRTDPNQKYNHRVKCKFFVF